MPCDPQGPCERAGGSACLEGRCSRNQPAFDGVGRPVRKPEYRLHGRAGLRDRCERELPGDLLSIVWPDLTTRGAVSGSLAGLLASVGLVALSPGVWTATFKLGPAPFPYDNL